MKHNKERYLCVACFFGGPLCVAALKKNANLLAVLLAVLLAAAINSGPTAALQLAALRLYVQYVLVEIRKLIIFALTL